MLGAQKQLRGISSACVLGRRLKGRFALVRYEEGGPVRSQDEPTTRLVCITDSDEKLVVWGEIGNTANIDKVLRAGLPCEVECEYREPEEWARNNYRHKYWVPSDTELRVV